MNQKILWGVIALVVVVAVVMMNDNDGQYTLSPEGDEVGTSSSPAVSAAAVAKKKASPTPASVAVSLSYNDALKKYGDNRIQFNEKCQAYPTTATYKNGASVMLDNRSNKTLAVSLDGKPYSLGAYTYQAVTLSSKTLPHEVRVNCGSSVNVMELLLQATIGR